MRTFRRISQLGFLFLFIFLFFQAHNPYEAGSPSDLFLRASPLLAITTFVASHTFALIMILAVILLSLTIPLGRFFCGWLCPLGTTINISDKLTRSLRRRYHHLYHPRMRAWKFFLLTFILVTSGFSLQLVGMLDPMALLTRTVTVVLYPAFAFVLFGGFHLLFSLGWFEEQIYTLYSAAQSSVLPIQQPVFVHGFGIFSILGYFVVGRYRATILVPRLSYCEFSCTLCGEVCPTGAIQTLTESKKQTLKIGRAYFDKNRCFPWNSHQDCLVCEEHCPLPKKQLNLMCNRLFWKMGIPSQVSLCGSGVVYWLRHLRIQMSSGGRTGNFCNRYVKSAPARHRLQSNLR